MEERFVKLNALLEDETKASEVFNGTKGEAREKLAAIGIEFSEEEFNEFLEGVKLTLNKDTELNEDDLEQVAGGCSTCRDFGHSVGKTVGRILNVAKWFFGLFAG